MFVLSALTGGVLRLLLHWYPQWMVWFTASKCPLSVCDHVLVRCVFPFFFPLSLPFCFLHPIKFHLFQRWPSECCVSAHQSSELQRMLTATHVTQWRWRQNFTAGSSPFFHLSQTQISLAPLHAMLYNNFTTWIGCKHWWTNYWSQFIAFSCHFLISTTQSIPNLGYRIEKFAKGCLRMGKIWLKSNWSHCLCCSSKRLSHPFTSSKYSGVLSPIYFCHLFSFPYSVTVWYMDNYAYFASIIVAMSVLSISMDVYQIRKQERKLRWQEF